MDRELNRKLNKEEQDASLEVLESWPVSVIIPTGSRCNLQCVFCTNRDKKASSHYKDLSYKEFLKYSEPLRFASSVGLYGWGEPLVNPEYAQMFEYVKDSFPGIEIHISSNGVLLSHEWAKRLVTYDHSAINISLNAATPETFFLLTKSTDFAQITKNIKALGEAKESMNKESPLVSLSFLLLRQNIHELPSFIQLTADLGVECVLLLDLILLDDRHHEGRLAADDDTTKGLFLRAQEISKRRGVRLISFSKSSFFRQSTGTKCFDPWESFKVSMNGDVSFCCYSPAIAGSLSTQSVSEVWNGEVYRYYRTTVNTDTPPPECQVCPRKEQRR